MQDFQQGGCSITELETRIERDIALGTVRADQLLESLIAHHAQSPMKADDFSTLQRCITSAETRLSTRRLATGSLASGHTGEPTAPTNRPVQVGDVINGRFILQEEIGRGGMSQVFRATDKRRLEAGSREPDVALKVMEVRGANPADAFVAMQREAQKSQQLNHPNILRVNDFDRDGHIVYTIMELLRGESLQQKIARHGAGGVPLEEAVEAINAMGSALAYAHEHKIVHADFKPSNVFVTTQGVVKVIDFGIARAIQAPDTPDDERTRFDPRALGALTPAYASPEMLEDREPDYRDDVYSLGCVAYETLTGRHPFARLRATDARDSGHPLKPVAKLSEQQWAALRHALEFERTDRTPSIRAFLEEFNRTEQPRVRSPLVRRLSVPVGALLGCAALAAGGTALWWWRGPDQPALFQDCAVCPPLARVDAGTTAIGADSATPGRLGVFEYPRHPVEIAAAFALGTREVTVAQFRAFAQTAALDFSGCRTAASGWQPDPSASWENPGFPQSDHHPVTCVSWNDAVRYSDWLTRRTGLRYRLPSEAEWEYAARTHTTLPLGLDPTEASACNDVNIADATLASRMPDTATSACNDGFAFTAPVDRQPDDALSDMRGNVFEWTRDCWYPSYVDAPGDGSARVQSGDCAFRVLRGGSWFTAPREQRLTFRNRADADYRSNTFGFRIAREIDEPNQ